LLKTKYGSILYRSILLTICISNGFCNSRYITVDRELYRYLEYQLIRTDELSLFIMNQPYNEDFQHNKILDNYSRRINSYPAKRIKSTDGLSVSIYPGLQSRVGSSVLVNPSAWIDGYLKYDKLICVNRLYASKQLNYDENFHGDKDEWVSAYMYDAYVRYFASSQISIFGGRTARNYGIPNEFSLFLSDNPYPYDHFGFSATGRSIQFSWYFGRLNDMDGYDDQGVTIPFGETQNVKRYLAFQRVDWKIGKNFQVGLSEATLYGGENQSFVGAYLNPLNFYYLSQRNKQGPMNGSWQINVFFYSPQKWAYYLDFYIDDIIINNDRNINDRGIHPDRLAIMTKISIPDLLVTQNLTSLRYVRVWNETYVTYRNYENWTYFYKGLGFPTRSYEGLKLESSIWATDNSQMTFSIEGWRKGSANFSNTFVDEANTPFPISPVTRGVTAKGNIMCTVNNASLIIDILIDKILSEGGDSESNNTANLSLNYRLNFSDTQ
jgi:hypothetical protein